VRTVREIVSGGEILLTPAGVKWDPGCTEFYVIAPGTRFLPFGFKDFDVC